MLVSKLSGTRILRHHWQWSICALPREDSKFGFRRSEDAFYVSPSRADGTLNFGLADGVGGLRGRGADPGIFATRLMILAAARVARVAIAPTPRNVLKDAAAGLAAERVAGGATALVARVSVDGFLSARNLGDCTLLVARADGAIVAGAERGLAAFDTPRQLGAVFDGGPPLRFDTPAAALPFEAQLEVGDWIIAATDGLTDNVFPDDIAALLKKAASGGAGIGVGVGGGGNPSVALACTLVAAARANANDRTRDSPFALLAKENDVAWTKGGRPDDMTVLVARWMVGEGEEGEGQGRVHGGFDALLDKSAVGLVPVNCAG